MARRWSWRCVGVNVAIVGVVGCIVVGCFVVGFVVGVAVGVAVGVGLLMLLPYCC